MALTYQNMTPVVTGDGDVVTWYETPGPAGTHYTTVDEGCLGDNTPDPADYIKCFGNVGRTIDELKLAPGVPAGVVGQVQEFRLVYRAVAVAGTVAKPGFTAEIIDQSGASEAQVGETKTVFVGTSYATLQICWRITDSTPFSYNAADWRTNCLAGKIILRLTGADAVGYDPGEEPDFQE